MTTIATAATRLDAGISRQKAIGLEEMTRSLRL
jgi:hypothetical protein